ncbi:unnamed protein product [Bursaphelenchus okinawaensis]|uniref:Chorein_N domain-containing protein n=1 Tax=Bursaphelenchus okinawaensis TaxID=465554 RepID=A0A811KME0_9BILA|nr:unnamed protein product [Bursaphelenchus okinawaensis]CAG9105991.1 unnamed protein product [Bursaphelenchus okinawaensis]
MASLIKNQIIKHLSVFARNLTPDQISVEVLRGKGELRNIVLNEEVLSEKLELPPWLKIRHASCNRVTVNIPWTSLKSLPVELHVDEIHVLLELCADDGSAQTKKSQASGSTSYGFGDRVVEGMSLFVNNVEIEFTSDRFRGSVMLSRLEVMSQTPNWKKAPDLKHTRFHDHSTNKVMFFKHISWQLLRIEARAIEGKDNGDATTFRAVNSPLRLITSAGKCRVVIKKSSVDGSLICGRMQTILEEVLWVATLPQLRSAIMFAKYIVELIEKSQEAAKNQKPESLKSIVSSSKKFFQDGSPSLFKNSSRTVVEQNREMSQRYKTIDFNQSSNHVYINRIDLHLCDDGTTDDFPTDWDINNGAIQMVLTRLSLDIYPSHSPLWKREDWVRYDATNSCANEAEKLVVSHLAKICEMMNDGDKRQFTQVCQDLRSQHIVIRIDDLLVNCVSQQTSKKEQVVPMIHPDTTARQTLPNQTPIFHMELASYYYLNPTSFPVPPNASHMVIGPLIVSVDPRSVRWLVYVSENLLNVVDVKNLQKDPTPTDTRIEVLLPRVYFDLPVPEDDNRYPNRLSVSLCTVTATNYHYEQTPQADVVPFKQFSEKATEFMKNYDESLVQHVINAQKVLRNDDCPDKEFFLIKLTSLVINSENEAHHSQPAMSNDFNIDIYVVEQPENHIKVAADPQGTIELAIDHFQFAQIIKVQQIVNVLMEQIKSDRVFFHKRYCHKNEEPKVSVYCALERVILNIVLPPIPVPSPYEVKRMLPTSDTEGSLSSDFLE